MPLPVRCFWPQSRQSPANDMPRRLSRPSSSAGPKPPLRGPLCYLGDLGGHLCNGSPRWDQIPRGDPEMDGAKEPAQLRPHEHPWAPNPKHPGGSCSTGWWASVPQFHLPTTETPPGTSGVSVPTEKMTH